MPAQVYLLACACLMWLVPGVLLASKFETEGIYTELKLASDRDMFVNQWAVVLVDHAMASEVAIKNGFANLGEVYEGIYLFTHRGIPSRRKRAALVKTMHLQMDTRVIWAEQQVAKVRKPRSISLSYTPTFNDYRWIDQWYLHRDDPGFEGHDMNVVGAWKRGYTGKGVVVSILDDGIEHTHPELQANYDPRASYDYNNNDTDPMPRYNWNEENRHGTRCAGEVAAVGNNSFCIVGVAYEAKIGGIRMLDGEITDLVESLSLRHAQDYIDIYSSSWGPEDDGQTVDGPGRLTRKALQQGATKGRNGKGSIIVWASGNGGVNYDNCNCDGYTNSIYTISVSAANSAGHRPWYLESCASTLVSAYSSGDRKLDRHIVTSDLNGGCTDRHTGTSVTSPFVAGFIALALQANPNLTWRDVQHILVRTSSLSKLTGSDFAYNAAGFQYSHDFGFGIVNGGALVELAEVWPTVSEQHACHHRRERKFPNNVFNASDTMVIDVETTACMGSPQYVRYVEHVHVVVSLYHQRRGSSEILVVSPSGTRSWVLRRRDQDRRSAGFDKWSFLSTHFWGEDPRGEWKIMFFTRDDYAQGYLHDVTLILYGSEYSPGVPSKTTASPDHFEVMCDGECLGGCTGPEPTHCLKCTNYFYLTAAGEKLCLANCPADTYTLPNSNQCLSCHASCSTCVGPREDECMSCPQPSARYFGQCLESCPVGMYKRQESTEDGGDLSCQPCAELCEACSGEAHKCTSCVPRAMLEGANCVARCKSDEYAVGDACQPCHPTCRTCVAGGSGDCLLCPKKALHNVEDRYLHIGHCVRSCPLGTYKANTIQGDCLPCAENCIQCDDEGRKCEVCNISYFRVTSGDGLCVKKCPEGYYADLIKRTCEQCEPQCRSCVTGNEKACTTCFDGFFLKGHECVPASECQRHYYVNKTSGKCEQCPSTCMMCQSASYCTACFLNHFLTPLNECVDACPNGTYPSMLSSASRCAPCHKNCSECDGPTPSECIACGVGMFLHNSRCVEVCPETYYGDNSSYPSICKPCHHTCKTCGGPGPMQCEECIEKLDKRGDSCVNPCPGQWSGPNNCQNCHPSCSSCYGPNADQCLECARNFSLNMERHTCSKVCHRKYFKDEKAPVCRPCHHSCASCSGPGADQCLSCPSKLLFHNSSCVRLCPTGWYKIYDQRCAQCSSRCGNCLYKYDLCTTCKDNDVWKDFKCFKDCGSGMFRVPNSDRCAPCHESCLDCVGTAPDECTACSGGMTLHNNVCLPGCLPGFYNSSTTGRCEACPEECLRCEESDDQLKCSVCTNVTVLHPDGFCSSSCPDGTYRSLRLNKCLPCSVVGCRRCDRDEGTVCTSCYPPYELSPHGVCDYECPDGTYGSRMLAPSCEPCLTNCKSCRGPSASDCLQCRDGVFALWRESQLACHVECPTGYAAAGTKCEPCNATCLACSSSGSCSRCKPPLLLMDARCVETCPNGFYGSDNMTCARCSERHVGCDLCDGSGCLRCGLDLLLQNSSCVEVCKDGYVEDDGRCTLCVNRSCMMMEPRKIPVAPLESKPLRQRRNVEERWHLLGVSLNGKISIPDSVGLFLVMALVLCVVLLSLMMFVRSYFQQEGERKRPLLARVDGPFKLEESRDLRL